MQHTPAASTAQTNQPPATSIYWCVATHTYSSHLYTYVLLLLLLLPTYAPQNMLDVLATA
jgi:hypothetical protein